MGWDVIGHEWAARLLKRRISRQQVGHAYLLTGPKGVGRCMMALQFAQALNCLQPPEPGQPCGVCRVCKQIAQMQHPDLSVVQAENEGGTLKVEQVRSLQHTLSLSPYEARYRVALLLRFEEANANAQNALLKTLEEAPPRVILILTADNAENLLPTIVSRCEVLRLRPLPVEQLQLELGKRQVEPNLARLLAHLSGGRLGYALNLLSSPAALEHRRTLLDDMVRLLGATRRERFAYAELISKDREALRKAYLTWLSFWRDLVLRIVAAETPLVNLDMQDTLDLLARRISLPVACARIADLERAVRRLEANLNPRLLTEVLLLDWPRIETTYLLTSPTQPMAARNVRASSPNSQV